MTEVVTDLWRHRGHRLLGQHVQGRRGSLGPDGGEA